MRRLEARGLPRVPGIEPPVYLRDLVLEWLADESRRGAAPPAPAPTKKRGGGGPRGKKAAPAKPAESPIKARMRELRGEIAR